MRYKSVFARDLCFPLQIKSRKHSATHRLLRDWCVPCIAGNAPETGHIRQSPVLQHRYRCVNWTISPGNVTVTHFLTVLNFLHCPSGASFVQCCEGPANHVVQAVTTFMDFLGLKKICLRTDGEPASGASAQAIKIARNDETQLETTPRYSSSSLGAVERSN